MIRLNDPIGNGVIIIQRGACGRFHITRRSRTHVYDNPCYHLVYQLINLIERYHFNIYLNCDGWVAVLNSPHLTQEAHNGQE